MTGEPGPVPDDGRFGQLTYSSFDSGDGPGGWQVKETQGLTGEEVELLTSRIATRTDDDVDRFPTPEQIAALPRRLVYGPTGRGPWAYWHTTPAGVDGSGRPGNVFAHVVLDRRPAAVEDDLRPADLWRSEDWLVPFNPEQVLAARLRSVPRPRRRPDATTTQSLAFLMDPDVWRLGLLPGLLDAVAAGLVGGPAVVLGVASVDRGADWIAAVSRLTSSAVARRLPFSTLERADTVAGTVASGIRLLCVPRDDLARLEPTPGVVVLDEDELVQVGALGGEPHVTERGAQIRVTPWSALAVTALDDADRSAALLADMEDISHRTGDAGAPAGWPLAVATLAHPEVQEGREEAGVAVLEFVPAHLGDDELAAVVSLGAGHALGRSAADAWQRGVELRPAPTSATAVLVRDVYLARAFADRSWLDRPEPAPYAGPDAPPPGPEVRAALLEQVLQLRADAVAGADPLATAVVCLRAADLATRAGLVFPPPGSGAGDDEVEGLLLDETERSALPLLFDEAAVGGLLDRVGPLAPRTREALLVPLVRERMANGADERLPRAASAWLQPDGGQDEARLERIGRFEGLDDPFETQQVLDAQARLGAAGGSRLARAALVLELHARTRAAAAPRPVPASSADPYPADPRPADPRPTAPYRVDPPAGEAYPSAPPPLQQVPGSRWLAPGGALPPPSRPPVPSRPPSRPPVRRTAVAPSFLPADDGLVELAARADLDARAALDLLDRFPGLPTDLLAGTLKSRPQNADMAALCHRTFPQPWVQGLPSRDRDEGPAQRLVRLRSTCYSRRWYSQGRGNALPLAAASVHRAVAAALQVLPDVPLDPTLLAHGQAAWTVSGLAHHRSHGTPPVAGPVTATALSGAPADTLLDLLRSTVVPHLAALYGAMSAPTSPFVSAAGLTALAGLRVTVDGVDRPVLDAALQDALQGGEADRGAVLEDAVQTGVQVLEHVVDVDKATLSVWKDLVGTHVRSLAPRGGVFGGRFRRG